jgi:hypothetical protein
MPKVVSLSAGALAVALLSLSYAASAQSLQQLRKRLPWDGTASAYSSVRWIWRIISRYSSAQLAVQTPQVDQTLITLG